ncbi:MAG: malate synthase A [Myxococcota bacterium]
MAPGNAAASIEIRGETDPRVLTPAALSMVEDLCRRFGPRRAELLAARPLIHSRIDAADPTAALGFLDETAAIRASDWTVRPPPADLVDRRVEITGPCDRKMLINALNSGASVFMADLEDATSPTWANVVDGHRNLTDAAAGTLGYTAPDGRVYQVNDRPAVLMVRPRGWHLDEPHLVVDGAPAPASLVDAGLFVHHAARALIRRGAGVYLYLPKLESHREAALWDAVLTRLEQTLDLPYGTVRVTVLIETLPAAFEMDEILWALRDRVVGLNCGRWDYIFSFVKLRRADPTAILPDRGAIGMTQPFLAADSRLAIETCHRRGAHAMGGMAAQIPIKGDPAANDAALSAVRADKDREVALGHDGTWVAHPGLVPIAKAVFDAGMPGKNQKHRRYAEPVDAAALLAVPTGPRTEGGLRTNLRVAVQYLDAWLGGLGCVPIDHRMEDAATAEISRVQVWQWVHHAALVRALLDEEVARLAPSPRTADARALIERLCLAPELAPFLTSAASAALTEE